MLEAQLSISVKGIINNLISKFEFITTLIKKIVLYLKLTSISLNK
jgi:hypothetical protein